MYTESDLPQTETWRNQDERRYELTREVAAEVLTRLSKDLPVVTYGDGPPTTLVSTLYFDTAENYYLERARAGNGVSSIKVRAREYFPITNDGDRRVLGQSSHCYLERKERAGTIRQKYRVRLEKGELTPVIEHVLALPEECGILRDEIRSRVLEPAMISMYERRVWGGTNDLRVTFDERIRYYKPPSRLYDELTAMTPAQLGPPTALGPKRILEVKHSALAPLPDWLVSLVAEFPEATGFSKFLDGMTGMAKHRRHPRSLTQPVLKGP